MVGDAEPPGDGVDRVDAPAAQLAALGHGHLVIAGHEAKPPLRHLEILVILLAEKELSLDQLHTHLYGDNPVGATTLKSEISRLRHTLGGGIASRPYRLTVPVRADFTDVLDALRRRDLATATRRYTGQLLPASEAPYVTDLRHHIDVALRNTLLRHGTAAQLLSFADVHPFDLEVLEQATRVATPDDPTTADLAARLTRPTPTRLSNHASAGRQRG